MEHKDTRPRYKAICPHCNKEIWVCKSLGMEMGWINFGVGTCPACGTTHDLIFDFEKESFTVIERK